MIDLAEFERIQVALSAVLDEHLGPSPDKRRGAHDLMVGLIVPPGALTSAMNRKRELEKLNRLSRGAREFASAWRDLHFDVQGEIRRSGKEYFYDKEHLRGPVQDEIHRSRKANFDDKEHFRGRLQILKERLIFWNTVRHLDKMIGVAVPKARALIETAPEVGRSDIRVVDAVHALREIWGNRKGKPAPRNVAEGSAFYKFVEAAFAAMEMKSSVRSAIDSWRKYNDKHPEGVRKQYRVKHHKND
jgi:hypothetical protein